MSFFCFCEKSTSDCLRAHKFAELEGLRNLFRETRPIVAETERTKNMYFSVRFRFLL